VIHGDHDTLTTVDDAREFVESLRQTSENAVVRVELRGAQHCFDIYHSPRMEAVIDVAHAFGAFAAGP
jgi:acetyl esterase/lipase